MDRKKSLVLYTAASALFLLIAVSAYHTFRIPDKVHIDITGMPTLGKRDAKVEIVLFEDFRCSHCYTFSTEIFPKIYRSYIHSGKASYTIIPLAFLSGSKPLANAAIAVYRQAPGRFLAFLNEMLARYNNNEMIDGSTLMQMARKVGGINLIQLQECIESNCYYSELDRNIHIANKVMGRNFATPALYIDGLATSTSSYPMIQARIEKEIAMREP